MTSTPFALLRRLAEQQRFDALRESCLEAGAAESGANDPDVRVLLALALVHLGEADQAERLLDDLPLGDLDLDARVDLAAVHIASGAPDRATALLEAALPEGSAHGLLLARLALCRHDQGRVADAIALYERSLAARPRIAVHLNLLRLYLQQDRLDDMAATLPAATAFWEEEQPAWPAGMREHHGQQLQGLQLDLWLARDEHAEAEAWLDAQFERLESSRWCALVLGYAQRLAGRDRHAQAEERLRAALQRLPDHIPFHGQLAELARLQGRMRQSVAVLRRAIRLAERQDLPTGSLLARLSSVALQHRPGLAREAAEKALELAQEGKAGQDDRPPSAESPFPDDSAPDGSAPDDSAPEALRVQAELALAGVEAHEQDYPAAEDRYRAILDTRPAQPAALQGLGQLCMQLGRIDEAVALFEQVKAIDPARGYAALINARRFPEDDATLARLESLARTPGLEGSVRAGLLLQLAAAWEKRADYDQAFALADEANAASRRFLHYDPKAHRDRCSRIRHAFPRALYEHRPDCGADSTLPVFVVGMPRSGTTLVEQILAGHSRIHGAGELGLIPQVIAGLERWERNTASGRHYPDCVDDLDPTVSRGIADNVLAELREYAPDAAHVVDKLPHNFENIGLIKLLFPRATIISVRRDPRDIAISNYFTDYAARHAGMGFAYDLDWIGEQLADHNALMQHWHAVFPGEIEEIGYEEVLENPEASARRMLEAIGVDWEPGVLDFNELDRPVKTASVWQVRQPLYRTSQARWRRYRAHLAPLTAATNRKIAWEPIDMVTLPEPGWLNAGVERYREEQLDEAEYRFQKLLHHLPEHAAANFMVGLIHVRKGHLDDGIARMEKAHRRCPWNADWRGDLARAYRLAGRDAEADVLANANSGARPHPEPAAPVSAATSMEDLLRSDAAAL